MDDEMDRQMGAEQHDDDGPEVEGHRRPHALNEQEDDDGPDVEGHRLPSHHDPQRPMGADRPTSA
jgi:hypothetical protein